MSSNNEQNQHLDEEGEQQQPTQTTTATKKKKITVLRKISAKPAPKKTSPKRSTTTDDVSALPASNNRGQNDDDDVQQAEQQQQAPAPRPTRKAASPKPQAKKSSTTAARSEEQREFDAAVAFLHATTPSNADIITANAVAAVEAMERKEAEEQQRRQQAQEEQKQAAAAAASSCEPLLSCSECHQQLPKSEFSSSQAKKLVGRKCKSCVAKVAEIEAQLREEAAVNEVLEKNRVAVDELLRSEQAQRKVIADEEDAAFRELSQQTPEEAYAEAMRTRLRTFLRARKWPDRCDPRQPVFHEWLISMESNNDSVIATLPIEQRPNEQAAALLLRDKGWTVVAAFELLADYASRAKELFAESLVHGTRSDLSIALRLINSLIDAGALDMLPQLWRNERNPLQQVKLLFRDSFQCMVQRVDAVELYARGAELFGRRILGAEFLTCILRILQQSVTAGATATTTQVVDFIKFLIDVKVAAVYKADGNPDRNDRPVAKTMNDLIRFLFISASPSTASSSNGSRPSDREDSPCFVARLLGLSNNNDSIPERISQWLCLLLSRCFSLDPSAVLWIALVADLFCCASPSVLAVMMSFAPSDETASQYESASPLDPVPEIVPVLVGCVGPDLKCTTQEQDQVAAHRSRALAAVARLIEKKSDDPVFTKRAREFVGKARTMSVVVAALKNGS